MGISIHYFLDAGLSFYDWEILKWLFTLTLISHTSSSDYRRGNYTTYLTTASPSFPSIFRSHNDDRSRKLRR
mgnify:CR=1 FL=1